MRMLWSQKNGYGQQQYSSKLSSLTHAKLSKVCFYLITPLEAA